MPTGEIYRDDNGNVRLECTCGLVVSGKTDLSNPLYTKGGSAWTNDSFPILDIPRELDSRHNPRNRCMHKGYATIALVPIKAKDKIIGLIQLNDRRKGLLRVENVEMLESIGRSYRLSSASQADRKRTRDQRREIQIVVHDRPRCLLLGHPGRRAHL